VFNPMTTSQVVGGVGRAAREAARGDDPASEFSRGQLLSAFSATRHVAVELAQFPSELHRFAGRVADELEAYADRGELNRLAAALRDTGEAAAIGDLLARALDILRSDGAPAAGALRACLHSDLRGLCRREVELLAEAIEGPAQP
jgi:hypothetical protein